MQNIAAIILIITLIIFYSYYKYSNATIKQSEDHIRCSTNFISERIALTINKIEHFTNSYVSLLDSMDLKNYRNNIKLYQSFHVLLESSAYTTSIFYVTADGLYVEYGSSKRLEKCLKLFDVIPPERTKGILIAAEPKIPNNEKELYPESWNFYFFSDTNTLSQPTNHQVPKYDPRNREWYIESSKTQNLIWSRIRNFGSIFKNEKGMTVSKPILNQNGTLYGIFGIRFTMTNFSEYLAKFQPSKNGNIYILNKEDNLIASSNAMDSDLTHGSENFLITNRDRLQTLKTAIENFKNKSNNSNFTTFELDGIEYLAFKTDFPKKLPDELFMIAISPLDDFIGHLKQTRKNNILLLIFIGLLASISSFILAHGISNPIRKLSKEANKIKELDFGESPIIKSNIKEIQDLNTSIAALKTSIQSFSYYIPKNMVKRLMLRKQAIHMGGRKKEVTLFFSDIEGFTTISETMNAEHLSMHLCDYFDALGNIITHHDGTIDKFIGDSIMAFWGAPIADRYHSRNACKAALECQRKLSSINRIWKNEGKSQLKTRIGIHTGEVIIGNIGSSERMNYTAMGDNVNFCSRLEGLNKVYGTKIIISETVVGELKNHFYIRSLDNVIVKGKTKPLRIYELVGLKNDDPSFLPSDETINFNEHFEQAYHLYLTRQFKDALKKFKEINDNLRTNDLSVLLYIERCGEFIKNPPPKDWDGAYQHTHK